ncbi:hypothetical protein EX30DRAFT_308574 [Ascodesmis nigricans]|uniref:Glutathione hydrolase n=1 Tax=Ascodesmis nigricans TaxID=341454 RepID=A0A4S2MT55_9PEZI|nr:hypothetical protein EX30DRAFT_308574 [Ascodesmis nigricans]
MSRAQVRFSPHPVSSPAIIITDPNNSYFPAASSSGGSSTPEEDVVVVDAKTPLLPPPVVAGRRGSARYGGKKEAAVSWKDNAALVVVICLLSMVFGVIVVENKKGDHDDGRQYLVKARRGVVSSDVLECSEIGVDVMRDGGNAIDAVIAAGACIGTINMFASGIGGGGFMVTRLANGTSKSFNFRERAPVAAHRDMFEHDYEAAKHGGLAIGVPGELHGLATAHQYYGQIPWHRLWEPSVNISRRGFPVTPVFAKIMAAHADFFKTHSSDGWDFLLNSKTGELLKTGDTITRPNFANTLSTIAGHKSTNTSDYSGVTSFYNGALSESLITAITASNGIITPSDLADYFTEVTDTVSTTFHNHIVETCPPPCSGQVLLEGLNIVEELPIFDPTDPLTHHYIVEAMKWLSAGRTELGDPSDAVVQANSNRIKELMSKDWAEEVRRNISESTTYGWEHYKPSYEPNEVHGTSHIEAVDQWGNAASLTTTVNLYWGAMVVDKHTGVIFNNQMDDFSIPNHPNSFDLSPSLYNFIHPGKRPLSSSSPTIISPSSSGPPTLILGASGGSRILTGVFTTIINKLIFRYSLYHSIKAPRLHHQLLPDVVNVERDMAEWVVEGLVGRGHEVRRKGDGEAGGSVVHGIWRGAAGWEGMADWWRKGGRAAGY